MIVIAIALLLLSMSIVVFKADAKNLQTEKYYEMSWCMPEGGKSTRMPDRTVCDCLLTNYAVEVDFGKKWYEAIGQSLHYSLQTGKMPAILLIIETEGDRRYGHRVESVIEHFKLPIDVFYIGPGVPEKWPKWTKDLNSSTSRRTTSYPLQETNTP